MSPKEKAEELFRKSAIIHNGWSENEYTLSLTMSDLKDKLFQSQWYAPKEIALMCVYEIDHHIVESTPKDDPWATLSAQEYWGEVKRALEKL